MKEIEHLNEKQGPIFRSQRPAYHTRRALLRKTIFDGYRSS